MVGDEEERIAREALDRSTRSSRDGGGGGREEEGSVEWNGGAEETVRSLESSWAESYDGLEKEELEDLPENKPNFWTKKIKVLSLKKIGWWPWPRDPRDDPDSVFYGRDSTEYHEDASKLEECRVKRSGNMSSDGSFGWGPAQVPEDQQFDPLDKPVFFWWFPKWVLTGEGYHRFVDQQAHYRMMADRFGWELPPPPYGDGPAHAIAFYRQKIIGQGKWVYKRRFNIQTMFHFLGVAWLLRQVRTYAYGMDSNGNLKHPYAGNVLHGFIIALVGVIFPSAIVVILYGLIPLQSVDDCSFTQQAVFLLFTNPMSYVIIAFTQITIFIGCIDQRLPWRPLTKYAAILVAVYVIQVAIAVPIVLTVGYYAMQGLIALAINTVAVCVGIRLRLKGLVEYGRKHFPNIVDPAPEAENWDKTPNHPNGEAPHGKKWKHGLYKEIHRKARVYYWILATQTITYFVYFAWIYAYKEASTGGLIALTIMQFVVGTGSRKSLQHLTSRKWTGGGMFQIDVSFLICSAWVFSAKGVFVAFATPNFDASVGAFVIIFLEEFIGSILVAMLHHSQLWFRFRCWIKIWPRSFVRCIRRQDPEVIPIYEDMDLDGRGVTNAHGDYRRTKIRFDYFNFLGNITGYTCYVIVSVILRYGPNKEFFPFNDNAGPSVKNDSSMPFSDEDYFVTLYFAAIAVGCSLLGIIWTSFYINKYYPFIGVYWQEMNETFSKVPEYMGFYLMIITSNVMLGVMSFLIHNRIWYAGIGGTAGTCKV